MKQFSLWKVRGCSNSWKRHFDDVYIYDTYYELANILKEVKPYLIHVQGSMLGSDFYVY